MDELIRYIKAGDYAKVKDMLIYNKKVSINPKPYGKGCSGSLLQYTDDPGMLGLLLSFGANPNGMVYGARIFNGDSILSLAVMYNNYEKAKILLQAGADAEQVKSISNCIMFESKDEKMLFLLFDYGCRYEFLWNVLTKADQRIFINLGFTRPVLALFPFYLQTIKKYMEQKRTRLFLLLRRMISKEWKTYTVATREGKRGLDFPDT